MERCVSGGGKPMNASNDNDDLTSALSGLVARYGFEDVELKLGRIKPKKSKGRRKGSTQYDNGTLLLWYETIEVVRRFRSPNIKRKLSVRDACQFFQQNDADGYLEENLEEPKQERAFFRLALQCTPANGYGRYYEAWRLVQKLPKERQARLSEEHDRLAAILKRLDENLAAQRSATAVCGKSPA
jgi:hypothetical protein